MKLTSKEKIVLNKLKCITAFYELGYSVNIFYGMTKPYDFMVEINDKWLRIKYVKTKKFFGNSIKTSEEVDYYITFFKSKCYLSKKDKLKLKGNYELKNVLKICSN